MTRPPLLLLSLALATLFLAGCVEIPAVATPDASRVLNVTTTPGAFVPFNVSTPTPLPTLAPTPSPTPLAFANLSAEETVRAYFNAVNARDYANAYALVSTEFKAEDASAATLDAFESKLKALYPSGVTAAGISLHPNNSREVTFRTLTAGVAADAFFILLPDAETGFYRIRVPYPSPGKFYNEHARVRYTIYEQAFWFEHALDDYWLALIRANFPSAVSQYKPFRLDAKTETDGKTVYFEAERLISFGSNGSGTVHALVRASTDYLRYPYSGSKQVNGRTLYINPTGAQGRWAEQAAVICDAGRFLAYLDLDYNTALQIKYDAQSAYDVIAPTLFAACPP